MDDITIRYRHMETLIRENNPNADLKRIRAAFEYARQAHGTQMRKDGTEFMTHPLAAAEIVQEIGLDEDSICAALLHDCIEDTAASHEEIEKLFGKAVAEIVEGVTKLTRVTYSSKEKEQMENLRKLLMAMARDIRVILIKIADRLHNMRTMEYQSPEKQREKALETIEMYAPIAHRLGMQKIKWELEDLSIEYLDPIGCAEIREGLKLRHVEDENFVNKIQNVIKERLKSQEIECAVSGRIKHMYSIYRKVYSQNKQLSEVMDLYAFRVIVKDIADCYNVLGHIHELFRPIPGYFKDYISTPKPNMYQSLHTSVIGGDGVPFEVQIRTWEMHRTAEYGIAAHWKYKVGEEGNDLNKENYEWVKRLLESQQDSDAQEFMNALKVDMFADEVFVFTPSGDVVNLPTGSTPIDFAYNIHSEVGNKMTGAIVNGRMVPYSYELHNGEIVRILTSNASKGPSRDWMDIIKTPEARNKIRLWFKKEKREENIVHGKTSFENELRHANIRMSDLTHDDILHKILDRLSFATLDDMYAAIGYGGITALKAVNRVREELRTAFKTKKKEKEELQKPQKENAVPKKAMQGVIVEGIDNCLVKFARCCAPVPGDSITGFITRGLGVSVHRRDCSNFIKSEAIPGEAGRWVRVSWANTEGFTYPSEIKIICRDRTGLVADIASTLNSMKVKISSFTARDARETKDTKDASGPAVAVSVVVDVKNRDELMAAISKIVSIPGIIDVRRIG